MNNKHNQLSRREFLKLGVGGLGALVLSPLLWDTNQLEWGQGRPHGTHHDWQGESLVTAYYKKY